jgi:hypothetical protein
MTTTLYLDTEFNGFGGELISMALVSPEGHEWYECMDPPKMVWNAWVHENVLPVLGKEPIPKDAFRESFKKFIEWFDRPQIICDWHTDIMHFCQMLDGDSWPQSIPFEGTFKVIQTPTGEPKPEIPHNALSDARALMKWHQALPTINLMSLYHPYHQEKIA